MLIRSASLIGTAVHAKDGDLGVVHDILFDCQRWAVSCICVDVVNTVMNRQIRLPVQTVMEADVTGDVVLVDLTCKEVKPDADDKPEFALKEVAAPERTNPIPRGHLPSVAPAGDDEHSEQLVAACRLCGFDLVSGGERIGGVNDLVVDDDQWQVPYLVVSPGSDPKSGKRTLIATTFVETVDQEARTVNVPFNLEQLHDAPAYQKGEEVTGSRTERITSYFEDLDTLVQPDAP